MTQTAYNPHVSAIDDRLINPPDFSDVAKTALYYGIKHMDAANPAGINLSGQMIAVVGQKKNRKTTFVLNLVRNWCLQHDRLRGGTVLWESLESGQTPVSVKQQLICMEATNYLVQDVWGSNKNIPNILRRGEDQYTNMNVIRDKRDPSYGQESHSLLFTLSRQFALSATRSELQHRSIIEAKKRVDAWPLLFYGAPSNQGATKALEYPEGGLLEELLPYKRWAYAARKHNVKIIVVDHVNAYRGVNDYDRQQKAIVHAASAVAELGVVLVAICQPSRASTSNGGTLRSRGGDRWEEEANTVIHTRYNQGDDKMHLHCADAREAPFPDIWVPLEMRSGLLFPSSYLDVRT